MTQIQTLTEAHVNALFLPNKPLRDRIEAYEAFVKNHVQMPIPVKHEFIEGLYKREIVFPKGALATGKLHPVEHMDVMLEGSMLIATDDGMKRIDAPCTLISRAGTKKAGIALTKTRWVSYHPTSATTVEEVEAEIFCEYADLELVTTYSDVTEDHTSYKEAIATLGMTESAVQAQVQDLSDQTCMPLGYEVELFDSPIHGKGMFSCKEFKQGELIAPGRLNGLRTPIGRYTNHSANPNSVMQMDDNGNVYLYALRDINLEELTTDYCHSVEEVSCQA
tara:strand:- start:3528 stop:4361 length:834 start_codon:yes stop_codon:yes gene_type:complete